MNYSYLPLCITKQYHIDQKFNDDWIMMIKNDELEDANNRSTVLLNNCPVIVLFDADKIIDELLYSYLTDKSLNCLDESSEKNIFHQLKVDFPRLSYYYNYQSCSSMEQLFESTEKFKSYYFPKLNSFFNLAMMLSTQASFFYQFHTLHLLYYDIESEFSVVSADDDPSINIVDNNTSIDMIFSKTFKYYNHDSQKTINLFYTYFVISFELIIEEDGYLFQGSKYAQVKSTSLYWINEKNLVVI